MKILDTEKIRETDEFTIHHEPIKSIDLMERAALAFTERFTELFNEEKRVVVIAGTGNNGGDGMAIARLLVDRLYNVSAFVVRKNSKGGTEDFLVNYDRLSRDMNIGEIRGKKDIPDFNEFDVIIDSIFGSGLSRPVSGIHADVIKAINKSGVKTVSVDIASGLFCDSFSGSNTIVNPQITITFQLPKLAFMLPENDKYVGNWEYVDIGLDKDFIHRQHTQNFYVTREFIEPFIPRRGRHTHKGNFGKGLLITGSHGKIGASILSSRSFMRAGAGLLTVLSPECGYVVLQTAVPEAMVETSGIDCIGDITLDLNRFDAIGIGPGLGTSKSTSDAMFHLLQSYRKPLVIDADGLNILSENRHMLDALPEHSILTPHPGEFKRLSGDFDNDFSRLCNLRELSVRLKCYVVLKGAHSEIATPEGNVYFNSTGNPGMATGGSGDVLTGIITSLLAQHQSPFHATILGVYLHGLAGDFARNAIGQEALIASDLIEYLPEAFISLQEKY